MSHNKVNAFASCVKAFRSLKRVRKETFKSENVLAKYYRWLFLVKTPSIKAI